VLAQIEQGIAEVAQQPRRAVAEQPPLRRELDLARIAVEEPDAERAFQRPDQRAECRLRQVALPGRPREVLQLRQCDECLELARRNVQVTYLHFRLLHPKNAIPSI
jgi:hypothetical protein